MVIGFVLGLIRIVLELGKDHLSGFLYQFATLNFLYFCILLFLFSIVIMVAVSLLTEKPSEKQLNGLTFSTTVAADKASSRASWNQWDVWLSIIVLVVVVSVFIYFSPLGVG
jgi:SSS family solute:Na+ symporter